MSLRIVTFLLCLLFPLSGTVDDLVTHLTDSSRYNAKVRPEGYPVLDTINLLIESVDYIDDEKGEFRVQVIFRQQWSDHRFKQSDARYYAPKGYITLTDSSSIWTPDIFFINERTGVKNQERRNDELIRISNNGDVLYTSRLSLVLSCKLDFSKYPHDTQVLNLTFSSFAYPDDELYLQWRNEIPIQINPRLSVPLFSLVKYHSFRSSRHTVTGHYSAIGASLYFKRNSFGYYTSFIYVASLIWISMAYIPFWVSDYRIRYLISILTVFVSAAHVIFIVQQSPKTDYVKHPLDTWTFMVMSFVTSTLFVLVFVDFLSQINGSKEEKVQQALTDELLEVNLEEPKQSTSVAVMEVDERPTTTKVRIRKYLTRIIDKPNVLIILGRVTYPISFLVFFILYFIGVSV